MTSASGEGSTIAVRGFSNSVYFFLTMVCAIFYGGRCRYITPEVLTRKLNSITYYIKKNTFFRIIIIIIIYHYSIFMSASSLFLTNAGLFVFGERSNDAGACSLNE
jgi:hypothetical protein